MNMDNMNKCLEEVKSTGIFVCFCVELDCLDLTYINIRIYLKRPPIAQGYRDYFAYYIFLCYRPRHVRNKDV